MGYTTDFEGQIDLDKPLSVAHLRYLEQFAATRRQKRDVVETATLEDPIREQVGLPIGDDAGFYVGDSDSEGIVDGNSPPSGQPGLWCQWVPSSEGKAIVWDGGEKFYKYVEWMQYIVENFLQPWGYVANGKIKWIGEDPNDVGTLIVKDNEVSSKEGKIDFGDDEGEAPAYSRKEVIAALEKIVDDAKNALKRVKGRTGDSGEFLDSLHKTVNDLYHSVDEGKAELD